MPLFCSVDDRRRGGGHRGSRVVELLLQWSGSGGGRLPLIFYVCPVNQWRRRQERSVVRPVQLEISPLDSSSLFSSSKIAPVKRTVWLVHHAVTLVDLIRPTQRRRNLELDLALPLGLWQSEREIGFACSPPRPERVRPNSHTAENGDGDVVAPSFPLSLTCFMFSRLQRDLGTRERLLISRRGVRIRVRPPSAPRSPWTIYED